MGSNPMTHVLIMKGKSEHRKTKIRPCEDRERNLSDASTSKGTPGIASNQEKLEEARKDSSLQRLEGAP